MRSEKFGVANCVVEGQHIIDQHEESQHVRNRCPLTRIHNAAMEDTCCMQSQKVRILRHHYRVSFARAGRLGRS